MINYKNPFNEFGVTRDAERLGVRNWRIETRDKDGWRRFLESAKTLHGL